MILTLTKEYTIAALLLDWMNAMFEEKELSQETFINSKIQPGTLILYGSKRLFIILGYSDNYDYDEGGLCQMICVETLKMYFSLTCLNA